MMDPQQPVHVASPPVRFDIADIFRQHADAFAIHQPTFAQGRVIKAITACRTAKLGGHVQTCQACQDTIPMYNSCRNRHCPKCQIAKQAVWLAQREHTILPTHYFHVVLTLPEALREVVRQNPKLLLSVLMRSAASTLLTLGRDPKHLGAQLGVTAVLHTWTRTLQYHPHVHCIVTGGGLGLDGQSWVGARPGFLFAAAAIRRLFRGRFMANLRELYAQGQLVLTGSIAHLIQPNAFRRFKEKLYDQEWVVYAKPPFGGPRQVFAYLGRYTHRVGLTNARIKAVTPDAITFTTKESRTTTIAPVEFMRRFLMHVLPSGFVKIRHYGLFAGRQVNNALQIARDLLQAAAPKSACTVEPRQADVRSILLDGSWEDRLRLLTGIDIDVCRQCGSQAIARQPLVRQDTS